MRALASTANRSRFRHGSLALVALALLAAGANASAAKPDSKQARQLFVEATRLSDVHDYDGAIDRFKRAYQISDAPGLLFNIGQANRLKGDHAQAIAFFETYLRRSPGASNRGLVERYIRESRATIEAARAQAERDQLEREERERRRAQLELAERARAERQAVDGPRVEVVRSRPLSLLPTASNVDLRVRVGPTPVYRRWWFWTAAIGVVIAAGVATALAITLGGPTVSPMGQLGAIDGRDVR